MASSLGLCHHQKKRLMSSRKIKNMEEFAAVSGISRPTLSKFFNDPTSVRSSTRKRVEAALDRYDYRPNLYAMNQNRRLTKNIGVVNAWSFRNATAPAWVSRGIVVNRTPSCPKCFCCEVTPPTTAATWFISVAH